MAVERREKIEDDEVIVKFVDQNNGRVYRRLLCGLGWPYADKPGFVVVLAEDFDRDHSIEHSPRHYWVMAEHESDDIEEFHRVCLKFQSEYLFENVLCDYENPAYDLWSQYGEIELCKPYDSENITLNVVAQLIRKNTSKTRKTLHFGDSQLPGYLANLLPDEIENKRLDHNPPIAALGCVISEMERVKPIRLKVTKRRSFPQGPGGWMES